MEPRSWRHIVLVVLGLAWKRKTLVCAIDVDHLTVVPFSSKIQEYCLTYASVLVVHSSV
jgi:hypothetical protein